MKKQRDSKAVKNMKSTVKNLGCTSGIRVIMEMGEMETSPEITSQKMLSYLT